METQIRIPRGSLFTFFVLFCFSEPSPGWRKLGIEKQGKIGAPWQHASSFECVWQRQIHKPLLPLQTRRASRAGG